MADWIDLLTPFAILGCAAMVLVRAQAWRGQWVLFGVGGVAFTLGHGLHLSANSVSNVADEAVAGAPIVHLWDEVVSHYVWYTGLFLVMGALGWALRDRELVVRGVDQVVAVVVAVTLVNTYIEGGVPWLGLVFLGTALVVGLRWRPVGVARLMVTVGGMGLVLLVVWGVYWFVADGSVFPEFSELGWI